MHKCNCRWRTRTIVAEQTAGKHLRVTAQLINVEDGYHIWSERYDRELEDVFEIQDEITSEIVTALEGRIGERTRYRAKRGTENVEAYHLYLKGRYFWVHRQKGMMQKALEAYRQAVEKDPSYSLAYADSIAGWANLMGGQTERAISECEKALDIDRDNVQALSVLGMAHIRAANYEESISSLERVTAVTERMPVWQAYLGWAFATMGGRDEARAILHELMERSETEYVSPLYISWILSRLDDEGDAFEWLTKAFDERNPYLVFWRLPIFDGFRSDPRFEEMLRSVNLR